MLVRGTIAGAWRPNEAVLSAKTSRLRAREGRFFWSSQPPLYTDDDVFFVQTVLDRVGDDAEHVLAEPTLISEYLQAAAVGNNNNNVSIGSVTTAAQ
jgi:Ethanolamine utilization protein EutJ (predicted chaperonin)